MSRRTIIYSRQSSNQNGTQAGLFREAVEGRGGTVTAIFADDPSILGKGRYRGWRGVVAGLDEADQVVVASIGDLPGKTVADLLRILDLLRDHGVSLYVHREGIDTGDGAAAILDLITAYRAARLSDAIRSGQAQARAAGKSIGRPKVPEPVRRRILTALGHGAGVRPTARKFGVCAATVINISRMMGTGSDKLAA
jgi:DNA invertase Pin-like site-specific DNA recombinase